jgi:Peptidase C13 family
MTFAELGSPELPDNAVVPNHSIEQAAPLHLPLTRWLKEGLRAGFFVSPKLQGAEPKPWQLLALVLLFCGISISIGRLQVPGPAIFEPQAWFSSWWMVLLFIALAWWAQPISPENLPEQSEITEPKPLVAAVSTASACLVWLLAQLPASLVYQAYNAVLTHEVIKLPASWMTWVYWAAYIIFLLWAVGVTIFVVLHFFGRNRKAAVFAMCLIAAWAFTTTQFSARSWQEDYSSSNLDTPEKPRLQLSQQTFEDQQALWSPKITALSPQRPNVADVYGLVFSPYASQDVFLRESTMVNRLLEERFDASGRTIHLLNHGGSTKTHLWATTQNLQRAVEALAKLMDKEKDILVVYLTSHGGSDFKLAAAHWPLEVEPLTPQELRSMLDKSGIRHRVVAISACYAGGWADVLANEDTLVMTAADATHTSYGCGARSDLTYFGRAVFDEQLRKTHSFEQAFNLAVPIIKQREIEAEKPDGFSNPQIRIGTGIRPVLRELEKRLSVLGAKMP